MGDGFRFNSDDALEAGYAGARLAETLTEEGRHARAMTVLALVRCLQGASDELHELKNPTPVDAKGEAVQPEKPKGKGGRPRKSAPSVAAPPVGALEGATGPVEPVASLGAGSADGGAA